MGGPLQKSDQVTWGIWPPARPFHGKGVYALCVDRPLSRTAGAGSWDFAYIGQSGNLAKRLSCPSSAAKWARHIIWHVLDRKPDELGAFRWHFPRFSKNPKARGIWNSRRRVWIVFHPLTPFQVKRTTPNECEAALLAHYFFEFGHFPTLNSGGLSIVSLEAWRDKFYEKWYEENQAYYEQAKRQITALLRSRRKSMDAARRGASGKT